ncbi:hypothetical protein ACF06P_35560 [Streptomyces sp. NPDC015684]|uniref:hypothetical protein n=1 Tax=Streptomyces sp. NPDC015684 TaxID=3364963 RepID=UPI003702BA30
MSPRPEAIAAAAWWAQTLAKPVRHDLGRGAATQSTLANSVAALVRRQRSLAEIEAFRDALADEIERHLTQNSWHPDEPDFGSYMRAIEVGIGPDAVFTDAAETAGFELKTLDLPMKTIMWINPGIVKVAEGYGAPVTIVWRAET